MGNSFAMQRPPQDVGQQLPVHESWQSPHSNHASYSESNPALREQVRVHYRGATWLESAPECGAFSAPPQPDVPHHISILPGNNPKPVPSPLFRHANSMHGAPPIGMLFCGQGQRCHVPVCPTYGNAERSNRRRIAEPRARQPMGSGAFTRKGPIGPPTVRPKFDINLYPQGYY